MNQNNHVCKVCGAEYYFCDYCGQQVSFTPYKSVCCSIECYSKYLDDILASRSEVELVTTKNTEPIVKEVIAENEKAEESTEVKSKKK